MSRQPGTYDSSLILRSAAAMVTTTLRVETSRRDVGIILRKLAARADADAALVLFTAHLAASGSERDWLTGKAVTAHRSEVARWLRSAASWRPEPEGSEQAATAELPAVQAEGVAAR